MREWRRSDLAFLFVLRYIVAKTIYYQSTSILDKLGRTLNFNLNLANSCGGGVFDMTAWIFLETRKIRRGKIMNVEKSDISALWRRNSRRMWAKSSTLMYVLNLYSILGWRTGYDYNNNRVTGLACVAGRHHDDSYLRWRWHPQTSRRHHRRSTGILHRARTQRKTLWGIESWIRRATPDTFYEHVHGGLECESILGMNLICCRQRERIGREPEGLIFFIV